MQICSCHFYAENIAAPPPSMYKKTIQNLKQHIWPLTIWLLFLLHPRLSWIPAPNIQNVIHWSGAWPQHLLSVACSAPPQAKQGTNSSGLQPLADLSVSPLTQGLLGDGELLLFCLLCTGSEPGMWPVFRSYCSWYMNVVCHAFSIFWWQ